MVLRVETLRTIKIIRWPKQITIAYADCTNHNTLPAWLHSVPPQWIGHIPLPARRPSNESHVSIWPSGRRMATWWHEDIEDDLRHHRVATKDKDVVVLADKTARTTVNWFTLYKCWVTTSVSRMTMLGRTRTSSSLLCWRSSTIASCQMSRLC